jgi:ribosomal protein S14
VTLIFQTENQELVAYIQRRFLNPRPEDKMVVKTLEIDPPLPWNGDVKKENARCHVCHVNQISLNSKYGICRSCWREFQHSEFGTVKRAEGEKKARELSKIKKSEWDPIYTVEGRVERWMQQKIKDHDITRQI